MTKRLRKTHGPNICDAFKRAQHQPTGVPTPYARLRLLRPERGSAPSRWGCVCVCVCVRESVEGSGRGERSYSPAELLLSRLRYVSCSSVRVPFPLLARTEP